MMSGSGVAEREWLELAADLMAVPLTELPVERIALQLARTFRAIACSYSTQREDEVEIDGIFPLSETFAGHRAEIERWAPRNAPQLHPILQYSRASGGLGFLQIADVPERWLTPGTMAAWYERARPWGCADQLAFPVQRRADGRRAFVVGRDAPFSPRELDVARRVWPLLCGLDRQAQALRGLPVATDVASEFRLTPRELTVLGLLVEGLTAVAIGRRLTIGERTVQKHLEHAYTKLGVGDRLSAVLRAQQLGLLTREWQTAV
jgi:DNA-binding CsgD family transcriptional regulator